MSIYRNEQGKFRYYTYVIPKSLKGNEIIETLQLFKHQISWLSFTVFSFISF